MEFTVEQAMKAQSALRTQAGLPAESFPLAAFIGMLSDEIEELPKVGRSDGEIAKAISVATGALITESDVREHYASPEDRHRV